jgi:PKD repeat protein
MTLHSLRNWQTIQEAHVMRTTSVRLGFLAFLVCVSVMVAGTGCPRSRSRVAQPPHASFTASPTTGVVPLTVQLTDSSTGTVSSWSWDFGDGETSSDRNPGHQYSNPGTYSVRLVVTGRDGEDEAIKTDFITAYAPLQIDTTGVPDGALGRSYSYQLQASGGTGSYTWSEVTSTLAVFGLSISSSGAITGSPSVLGGCTFTARVQDNALPGQSAQRQFTLWIYEGLAITTTTLPAGLVGQSYGPVQLQASGGTGGYTWSEVTSTLAGFGLSLSSSGAITGSPSPVGTCTFTVRVQDHASPPQTVQRQLSITIYGILDITTTTLPYGVLNETYSATLAATGGTGNYAWSEVAPVLANYGLSLSSGGAVSGTATQVGTAVFTAQVQDDASPPQTAQRQLSITIYGALNITTTTLPDGVVNETYGAMLAATGGTGNYTWSEVTPVLSGFSLALASDGTISGTATPVGTASFTAQVQDDASPPQAKQAPFVINIYELLQITTDSTLPGGAVGETYSATLTATGGKPSYTWSEVSSVLPAFGLSLSSGGLITGTPTAIGTCTFFAQVTDSATPNQVVQKEFTITIDPLLTDFTVDQTVNDVTPCIVEFKDLSTGTITARSWDFGNGETSTGNDPTPSVTYSTRGWYTVSLTVTRPTGSATRIKARYVLFANYIWYVDANVSASGDGTSSWATAKKTIQEALTAAGDYDVVLVADATYSGAGNKDLDFAGKKIYLKAEDQYGTKKWIIDCEDSGRAFTFDNQETRDAVVDGFTVVNGFVTGGGINDGGGILCLNGSNPTIRNCIIAHNQTTAGSRGGGIACLASAPAIENSTISNNSSADGGGGILCNDGSPTITNCTIVNNSSSSSVYGGGGILAQASGISATTILSNCIVWANTATVGASQIDTTGVATVAAYYCDVNSSPGEVGASVVIANSINQDPVFQSNGTPGVDGTVGIYHLQSTSPCIDAGSNSHANAREIVDDLDDEPRIVDGNLSGQATVDIGAYEYRPEPSP